MALFESVKVQIAPPGVKDERPDRYIEVQEGHFYEKGSCKCKFGFMNGECSQISVTENPEHENLELFCFGSH